MKLYIIDDLFIGEITNNTGEEMIVYPVKINLLGFLKLKKEGISITKDPKQVLKWIKKIESETDSDFGGIMVKNFRHAVRFRTNDYNWRVIREIKEDEEKEKNDFKKNLQVPQSGEHGLEEPRNTNLEKDNDDLEK